MACDKDKVRANIQKEIAKIDVYLASIQEDLSDPHTLQKYYRVQGVRKTFRLCLDYQSNPIDPFIEFFVNTREWLVKEINELATTNDVVSILQKQGSVVAIRQYILKWLVEEGCLPESDSDDYKKKHTMADQKEFEEATANFSKEEQAWSDDEIWYDFMDDTETELQNLSAADAAGDYAPPDEDE